MTGRSGTVLARRAGAVIAAMTLVVTAAGAAAPADDGSLRESEWALTALKAEQAWDFSRGEGVTVAVIGTGVDASHPDLTGRVLFGRTTVEGTRDEGTAAVQGTHAAGIIAGTGRNYKGDGMYGLAPGARVLPSRVYRDDTALSAATAREIMNAARRGAQVIVVTVSFPRPSDALQTAVEFAAKKDALVVAGAGDNGGTGNAATYPTAYPGVLTVAATDKKGAVWPDSRHGKDVDLAAPGVDILTTARNDDYWTGSSTAYAASWVAASAALLRARHPNWTVDRVTEKLTTTATDKGPAGRDARYGFGLVAPAAALADSASPSPEALSADQVVETEERDAARSSDTGPILVLAATTAGLVVLAVVAWLLIRRSVSPSDDE
ncbi:S8 family serine peptidase [Streptomyces sp. NPDC002845]